MTPPITRRVVQGLRDWAGQQPGLFFRTPPTSAKDMLEITLDVDPARLYVCGRDDSLDTRAEAVWTFDVPTGVIGETPATRRAFILKKHQAVWVNVGDLEPGLGGGLIYQFAGAYARNNGWVLIGDPDGITEAGKRRRLENMIALALKYGSTGFIRPHDDMLGWNGLLWGRDDDTNLYALLRTSRRLVTQFYPEMNDARYDFDTGRFHLDGVDLEPAAFPRLAARKRAG